MLKIKDNVDLKELEKFGFQKGYDLFCKDDKPRIITAIVDDERNLKIQYSHSAWWDNDHWYLYSHSQDKIYDLIKADMVEKVDENDRLE
jgi:hypothetical protein